ncbi:hypothetical protein ACKVWC_011591 [Pyricularia oryzae]
MRSLFIRHLLGHLGRPPLGRLLDGADVEDSVVQMVRHAVVRRPSQERPVVVDAAARQERHPGVGNVLLDVGQQAVGSLLGRRGRAHHPRRETAAAVLLGAPLIHLVHAFLRLVNHRAPALFVLEVQVTVRDEAEYFDNLLRVWVETRHLECFWLIFRVGIMCVVFTPNAKVQNIFADQTHLAVNPY